MHHHLFVDTTDELSTAVLIKDTAFNKQSLEYYYVKPLVSGGFSVGEIVAFDLLYEKKKAPKKLIKSYLMELMPTLLSLGIKQLLIADAEYFKEITGKAKAEANLGYMLPCALEGFTHIQCTFAPNYQAGTYNESAYPKIETAVNTLIAHRADTYIVPGTNIIHSKQLPTTLQEIKNFLSSLHQYPELTVDIEAFSLQFWKAGIGTISFAWDKHNGGSFPVDYVEYPEPIAGEYGFQQYNPEVRELLVEFFTNYRGKLIGQNLNYDFKILIYELFMQDPLDEKGKQHGIEVLTKDFDDTKLLIFLSTNSCNDNDLSLKSNAQSFAGNYAQDDINDIRRIPLAALLDYNLVDTLSTFFVYENTLPKVIQDDQMTVYNAILKPSVPLFLQVELTGMPLNIVKVYEVQAELTEIRNTTLQVIESLPLIKDVMAADKLRKWEKDFADRKSKAKNPDKILPKDFDTFPTEEFNPNSNPQVIELLYTQMGLPIIDRTKTKLPAVGGKTLKKLVNHTTNQDYLDTLNALISFFEVDKILGTFIKAFIENSFEKNGWYYLHGNFNIGGTKSGRLSSSGPNLQNMPAGKKYGKLIKSCFQAPKGWIFCGADFASLEDRISALTTKDINKIKVYTDGFDGHCLRAYGYFKDAMPDIDPTSVESINSIQDKYPLLRNDSKAPTFALTTSALAA